MAKCFIGYTHSYRNVMQVLSRIMSQLDFEVDVFDTPDLDHNSAELSEKHIRSADCAVVLIGPITKPEHGERKFEPAPMPRDEALIAMSLRKPLALFVHPGTNVSAFLGRNQTPVRFDFWNPADFMENVHLVVEHLLNLKRRVNLPPGDQPFYYTKAVIRNKISSMGNMLVKESYHEVMVRESTGSFHHLITTGFDKSSMAELRLIDPNSYSVTTKANYQTSIRIDDQSTHKIGYYVDILPVLSEGATLGYRRVFHVHNYYPLTAVELAERAKLEGFPVDKYTHDGRLFYGDDFEVHYEMESIYGAIHFPGNFKLKSMRVVVTDLTSNIIFIKETERCNSPDCLKILEPDDMDEIILELSVQRPINNKRYLLLYEPA